MHGRGPHPIQLSTSYPISTGSSHGLLGALRLKSHQEEGKHLWARRSRVCGRLKSQHEFTKSLCWRFEFWHCWNKDGMNYLKQTFSPEADWQVVCAGSHFLGTGSCSHAAIHFLKGVLQIAIQILVMHRHLLFSLLIHWRSCTHLLWPTHTLTHWPASPCPHIWTGACCPGSSGAVSLALPGTSPNSPLCSCAPSGTSSVQPGGGSTKSAGAQQCCSHVSASAVDVSHWQRQTFIWQVVSFCITETGELKEVSYFSSSLPIFCFLIGCFSFLCVSHVCITTSTVVCSRQ